MERQSYYRFIWSSTVAQQYLREFYSLHAEPTAPPPAYYLQSIRHKNPVSGGKMGKTAFP